MDGEDIFTGTQEVECLSLVKGDERRGKRITVSGGGGGIPLSSPCVTRFDFHPIKVGDEAVIIAHSERYGTKGVNGGLVGYIELVADIGGGVVVIHLRKFGPDKICKIGIAGGETLESDSIGACGPLINIGWVRQLMPCGAYFGITLE